MAEEDKAGGEALPWILYVIAKVRSDLGIQDLCQMTGKHPQAQEHSPMHPALEEEGEADLASC